VTLFEAPVCIGLSAWRRAALGGGAALNGFREAEDGWGGSRGVRGGGEEGIEGGGDAATFSWVLRGDGEARVGTAVLDSSLRSSGGVTGIDTGDACAVGRDVVLLDEESVCDPEWWLLYVGKSRGGYWGYWGY